MAFARLALKNLHQRVFCSPSSSATVAAASSLMSHSGTIERAAITGGAHRQSYWPLNNDHILKAFSTEATPDKVASETSDGKKVSVSEPKKSRSLFPRRNRRRSLWRRDDYRDFVPALSEFFPSGLGNALMQATENVNRVLESLNVTPWSLTGRVKEHEDFYKLRFKVPGLAKEDLKITVDDGVLTIKGEHKEEKKEEGGSDDDEFRSSRYGYYDASLVLPEDAKADEVKAALKDGVLTITVPRTEKPKRDVREVQIN